ncbi:MAG: type IV secretion system protein [Lactobacillaceae bacterium]|jgi:type IV secretory pathway component VirB8|nr:type IV secretion system protein [Lactobacillaceae bacterium]
MVEQLNKANVEQKLIGGASKQPKPSTSNQDTIVENVAEKRYLWTARAFAIITALSLCCNIVLLLAIGQIVPLFRVEPFLLTFKNKQEQVYNIVPVNTSLEDERAITEVFVRQYVLLRSTFDTDIPEMEARWLPGGPIQEMSSATVYSDFLDNTAKRAIDIIRTRSLKRDIRIITVNELSRGLWQVEYETQDMYPTSTAPELNYWAASLQVTYRRKTVKYTERLKNPVGFTVAKYSLARQNLN